MRAIFHGPATALALVAALAMAAIAAARGDEGNLFPNPSFEASDGDLPAGWRPHTWGGTAEFHHAEIGRSGDRSVQISSSQGADASWTTTVDVEPHSTYRLSGWIKTEGLRAGSGRGALLNVHTLQNVATGAVRGSRDWTQVEVVFDTGTETSVQLNCLFGGWGESTGTAWFDDVRLERLDTATLDPEIAIDATEVAPPIHPFVYGQFIEHLGRCIYGGIWAEMLEDRKFLHPVGAEQSPWRTLPGGGAMMVTMDSFVGEHTPMILLPGGQRRGLVQRGLALREGRGYEGRIWLAGMPASGPVSVSLVWADGAEGRETITVDIDLEYRMTPLQFTAGGSTDDGRLEIAAAGQGHFRVGTVSLMPDDNVEGMRADTLALLRELDAPIYRWPGGNFVSGYDWREGIGDRDRRPPRRNPAWTGLEHNDFGIDEFIAFCRLVDAEPLVVVNTGAGEVGLALAKLEYCNGPADSPMGRLRAENGREEPYDVEWWCVGNEMFGAWQIGYMPLDDYVQKHNRFAEAMRDADPSIQLIAVGAAGAWSEGMMRGSAEYMDMIAEHFYCQERPGVVAHVQQVPDRVRSIVAAHRRYREEIPGLAEKAIPIAITEWNYWYGPHLYGELGTRYFQKDALGIAAGLHEMARHSDIVEMANYAQTVNVIGAIKTTATEAAFETTGLVLKLYRGHFGTLPVATEITAPLDAKAAWTADRETLTLAVVNPTAEHFRVPVTVAGAALAGQARGWRIAHDNPMAYNAPGEEAQVTIEDFEVDDLGEGLPLAPFSVTLIHAGVE